MLLEALTLTGADNGVDPLALTPLVDRHPLVEWAILFSPVHAGMPRYPTPDWRAVLYTEHPGMRRAAHLCGQALRHLAGGEAGLWAELTRHYQRVQLNFNARRIKPQLLDDLVRSSEALANEGLTVITQHNTANLEVAARFAGVPRRAVLFDASGGRGTLPDDWPAPLPDVHCGYAGGLGPTNVVAELDRLNDRLDGDYATWIDMESGVRDSANGFDRVRARAVIEAVERWQSAQRPGGPTVTTLPGPGRSQGGGA